ncbi:hypothetical protein BH20CHL7_BH20CHL7_16820 [soil metagenome]
MADDPSTQGAAGAFICPWCSATYTGAPERCPSCNATLVGDAALDPSLPGLTAIDAAAIVRAKQPVPKQRNRLLSWISGDYPEEGSSPAEAAALAPPADAVRREMLRLQLEAEVASLQAESDALIAEAKVEGRPVPGPAQQAVEAADPEDAGDTAEADPEAPRA